jgi:acetamidase/formamidase
MAAMMARERKSHYLTDAYHFRFDNSLEPALTVDSGDVLVVNTLEGYGGKITPESTVEDLAALPWDAVHCLTGPIFVNDAAPGDVLRIDIIDIEHDDWAWTGIFPGIGVLSDEFGDFHLQQWRLGSDMRVELRPGVRIPIEPFCGVMGVAFNEPGEHLTMPPRRTGGNIDTRHLIRGTTLYLPVDVPGALLSVGDGHLAQGDGEVCGTALETNLLVTLRLSVDKGRSIRAPQFETYSPTTSKTHGMGYVSTSSPGDDLHENLRNAVRDMVDLLEAEHGLSRLEAYLLCSVAGDARISVPVLGQSHTGFVTFNMPRSIFVG